MNESMIIWCAIVALLIVVLLVRSAVRYSRMARNAKSVSAGMHHIPLLSIGKERDMLFMPGDALHADDDSDEY